MSLSRRAFIKLAGTAAVCGCTGALGMTGCAGNPTSSTTPAPEETFRVQDGHLYVSLSRLGSLLSVGGAVKFTLADANGSEQKVIVVRPDEADYRAFADACTHNGKELNYLHGEGLLACCGRSSRFNLAGKVIHGPAEEPLLSFSVVKEGNELVVDI